MRSVELFAGAGGLAMGMANAGFEHAAVLEWNASACETFRHNQNAKAHVTAAWPLHQTDVRTFDYGLLGGEIMVVSGGPPCQPFSIGRQTQGLHRWPGHVPGSREGCPRITSEGVYL